MVRAVTAKKSSKGLAWAAVIWILLALTAAAGVISLSLTQVLLSFGLLLIVPLGLDSFRWSHDLADKLRTISYGMAQITGPVAAISMLLPTGLASAGLAGVWFLTAAVVSLSALVQLLATRSATVLVLLRAAASAYLLVGAGWLVISRFGGQPLDLSHAIVELTAVHFHFAGLAAPLIAASAIAWSKTVSHGVSRTLMASGLGVVAAMPMVAAGITASPALEISGSVLIGLSLAVLGLATLLAIARRPPGAISRELLSISSIAVLAAMALAIQYALGQFIGTPALEIREMAQLHGALNAGGFSLCGLLGWRLATGGGLPQ